MKLSLKYVGHISSDAGYGWLYEVDGHRYWSASIVDVINTVRILANAPPLTVCIPELCAQIDELDALVKPLDQPVH